MPVGFSAALTLNHSPRSQLMLCLTPPGLLDSSPQPHLRAFALFREPTKQQPERLGDLVGRGAVGNERPKTRLKFLQPLQRLLELPLPAPAGVGLAGGQVNDFAVFDRRGDDCANIGVADTQPCASSCIIRTGIFVSVRPTQVVIIASALSPTARFVRRVTFSDMYASSNKSRISVVEHGVDETIADNNPAIGVQ
jgi:hypothetical protein